MANAGAIKILWKKSGFLPYYKRYIFYHKWSLVGTVTQGWNLWKSKQNTHKFETNRGYIVSSRVALTKQGDTVSKTEKK